MISLISFENDLIINRKEAQKLNLKFSEITRLGYRNNNLSVLSNYDYYKEDCVEKDGKYYKDDEALEKDKPLDYYYLYTKYQGNDDFVLVQKENHLVNLIEFVSKCKYKFFINESILSEHSEIDNIEMIFQRLEEKTKLIEHIVDKVKDNTFNKKTNVHVGGGLITTYNDLLLKENVCTDILQTELNNGWRIIAVCVQPDQRRPDYILGRYNPQLDVAEKPNAER